MDILKPAGFTADTSISSLCILPTFSHVKQDIFLLSDEKIEKLPDGMLPSLIEESDEALNEIMSESPRFKLVYPFSDSTLSIPDPSDTRQINALVSKFGIDALLSLQELSGKVSYTVQKFTTDNGNGLYGWIIEFHFDLTFNWAWENSFNHQSFSTSVHLLDHSRSQLFDSPDEAYSNLNNELYQNLLSRTFKATEKAAAYFSPLWETKNRIYFNKGNQKMREAASLLAAGNYQGAEEIWQVEANNKATGIAKHARFNLLLLDELNGRFEEGLNLADSLFQEYGMKEAEDYAHIFQQRLNDQKILDNQFPKKLP